MISNMCTAQHIIYVLQKISTVVNEDVAVACFDTCGSGTPSYFGATF